MQNKLIESIHTKTIVGSKARVGRRDSANPEPEISVQKQDGRIQSIMITCPCGEQITVVCEYAS